VWELDDCNQLHVKAKEKLLAFVATPRRVMMGRTAERDLSLTSVRKLGLLEAMRDFIVGGAVLKADFMERTGEEAYIFEYCECEGAELYVKATFKGDGANQRLFIFSAHPSRRW
jgi:hypothetical protein